MICIANMNGMDFFRTGDPVEAMLMQVIAKRVDEFRAKYIEKRQATWVANSVGRLFGKKR